MIEAQDARPGIRGFPTNTIRIAIAAMVLVLCTATYFTYRIGNDVRRVMQAQIGVLTAAERLEHYGTVLELSIKSVVAYGDREAATRYRTVQPQLRATLLVLRRDLQLKENQTLAQQVDRADLALVAMEWQALDLARDGELAAARSLIGSPRYNHLLNIYYSGIGQIEQRAGAYVAATDRKLDWYLHAVIGLTITAFGLIVLGWIALIRPAKRWGHELDEARERAESATQQLEVKQVELETLNARLFEQARVDHLTKLGSRLKFYEDVGQLWPRVERYSEHYCVVMCDIDYFKQYNDLYGHIEGDAALKQVADALSSACRGGDQVYRFGGEEFVILLPRCKGEAGLLAAERYRASVEALNIPHAGSASGGVTVSMGVAGLMSTDGKSIETWLNEADAALYEAKRAGRNRVMAAQPAAT